ncbi:uncharacterized CRM domain-containing protein At3g25440, chloroplastic isoform X1 [Ziziphus jujuba]|uniref:Uncharacterized CRM domain-containing protein At3g25440, chloroplastic isoform X1 n=2 Tax=Ziziphus jujuba TaxID=326968 RepID=A0A6P6GG25_ZIZJJ|nr:uncharacterized CRM domain-containing protein At3g25440, chloroplastic isoform X1 [Ziziphus jujuba]
MEKMMGRAMRLLGSLPLCKSHIQMKYLLSKPALRRSRLSLGDIICKVLVQEPVFGDPFGAQKFLLYGFRGIHSVSCLQTVDKLVEPPRISESNAVDDGGSGGGKVKRKKLKGKRAVVRWLKFFRWKKKKEYERMTAEEKILYKLRKAQKKEERLVEALKKIEPVDSSETKHDPEILTPEEHFYFLKMGLKCKNYVPVGRRGIYQGVILNMHLHWKKHQTLQVIVKTFSPEEVKEIAAELARLTGGIVLEIHEENTIIMYRGKNYSQPPTEIMSPRITLPRKKALDKSKYRDGLRAVRKYIPRLKQDLELLRAQAKSEPESKIDTTEETQEIDIESKDLGRHASFDWEPSEKLKEIVDASKQGSEDDLAMDADMVSDSEGLSDIFETDSDSDAEAEEKAERPLYMDEFEKFPVETGVEQEDFEDHLHQISVDSKKQKSANEDVNSPNFDDVDRLFLRAASLLKKRRR